MYGQAPVVQPLGTSSEELDVPEVADATVEQPATEAVPTTHGIVDPAAVLTLKKHWEKNTTQLLSAAGIENYIDAQSSQASNATMTTEAARKLREKLKRSTGVDFMKVDNQDLIVFENGHVLSDAKGELLLSITPTQTEEVRSRLQ